MQARLSQARERVFRRADRGVLLYGVTPPRQATPADKAEEIARATLARLAPVGLDALVLYDVDAEQERSDDERPFPFVPMSDPFAFYIDHLGEWAKPVVIYRAVAKYEPEQLRQWMADADSDRLLTVLVGSSSHRQKMRTSLPEAYQLHRAASPQLGLGGVLIAERHAAKGDEHRRMLDKQRQGSSFFISQICYDLDHTRNLLSDYAYTCRREGIEPTPVVLTLAPCGSAKTLDFMTWLGVDIPHWVRNDIMFSDDPLGESFDQCLASAQVLRRFCRRLGLPFGISVESVTNRKAEIEASVQLAVEIRAVLDGP
ncbi:MAG: 5,10-methylenetetrahydrofolate reductase [Actinomycetales bacterium]